MSRVLGESDRDRGAGGLIRGCRVSGSFEAMRDSLTGAESPRGPRYAIWEFNPLADFLSDHTLTGQTPSERLREYAARWVQFAGSLWEWTDRATFALRYHAMAGRVGIFFLAIFWSCATSAQQHGHHSASAQERAAQGQVRVISYNFFLRPDLLTVMKSDTRTHALTCCELTAIVCNYLCACACACARA